MATWLKNKLTPDELETLRRYLCCDLPELGEAPPAAPTERNGSKGYAVGGFVSNAQVSELSGVPLNGGTTQTIVARIKADPSDEALRLKSGNGWTFRKRLAEEMVQLGYTDRSPSWEVVQVGQL